jgi:hypothetical protein
MTAAGGSIHGRTRHINVASYDRRAMGSTIRRDATHRSLDSRDLARVGGRPKPGGLRLLTSDQRPPGSWWDRQDVKVRLVLEVLGIIALLAGWFAAIFGNPFAGDKQAAVARLELPAVALHQVTLCLARHHLGAQEVRTEDRRGLRIEIRRCQWPPRSIDGGGDGYSDIVDTIRFIPGKAAADVYSEVDDFRTTCQRLKVTFVLDHMGGRWFSAGILKPGHLLGVTVEIQNPGAPRAKWVPGLVIREVTETPFYVRVPLPTEGGFRALVNGHGALSDAECLA